MRVCVCVCVCVCVIAPETNDSGRLMELVPEEFCAEIQSTQLPSTATAQSATAPTPAGTQQAAIPLPAPAPEAVSQINATTPLPGRVAHPVRMPRWPAVRPPTAAETCQGIATQGPLAPEPFHTCGAALETDMIVR